MKPRRRIWADLFLFLTVALPLGGPVSAQEYKMWLTREGGAFGGSCEPGEMNLLAGSVLTLALTNTADQPLGVPHPGWPEGYVLGAALDLPQDQPFVPTPGLIEKLTPAPFFDVENLDMMRRLIRGDSSSVGKQALNRKHFAVHVPASLIGHSVRIRALCRRGKLRLQAEDKPVSIIAPCDRADTARIVASWMLLAWWSEDWERVIVLADSMLAGDLSDAFAWDCGLHTAMRLAPEKRGYYSKALAYLERMYRDFGVATLEDGMGVRPKDRAGPRDPLAQKAYERWRDMLLRLIASEEQKQEK